MSALTGRVAQIIYGLPFGVFGLMHFLSGPEMAGMVPSFIPGGVFWVYLTGLALLAASVSIITGQQAVLATKLLALMLGIFVLTIHLPAVLSGDPTQVQNAMPQLLKDLSLAGGALVLSGVFERRNMA